MKIEEVKRILNNVSFAPTNLDMGWKWDVKSTKIYDDNTILEKGYSIRTTFMRPDANTGEMERGYGRWMYVPENVSTDGLVKTAWLCAELIVKHELMEAFLYEKTRIFDPHKSLKDLQYNGRSVENNNVTNEEIVEFIMETSMVSTTSPELEQETETETVSSEKIFHKQNLDNHTQEISVFLENNLMKDKNAKLENVDVYDLSIYKVFHYTEKRVVALIFNEKIKDIRNDEKYTLSEVESMLNDLLLRYNTADPAVINSMIMTAGFTEVSDLDGNPEIKVYKNPSKSHRYIIHSNTSKDRFIALSNNKGDILKEFEGKDYIVENIKTLF